MPRAQSSQSLSSRNVRDLREMAKTKKIKGYGTMRKPELVRALGGTSARAAPRKLAPKKVVKKATTSRARQRVIALNDMNERIGRALQLPTAARTEIALRGVTLEFLRQYPDLPDGVTRDELKRARTRKAAIGLLRPSTFKPDVRVQPKPSPHIEHHKPAVVVNPFQQQQQQQQQQQPLVSAEVVAKDPVISRIDHNKALLMDLMEQRNEKKRNDMMYSMSETELADALAELGVTPRPPPTNDRRRISLILDLEFAISARLKAQGLEVNVDVPCPVAFANVIARQAPLTRTELGIYAGVRDNLYPYPFGSDQDKQFLNQGERAVGLVVNQMMFNWELMGRLLRSPGVRDICRTGSGLTDEVLTIDSDVKAKPGEIDSEQNMVRVVLEAARYMNKHPVALMTMADTEMIHMIPMAALGDNVELLDGFGKSRAERQNKWMESGGPTVHCDKHTQPWLPVFVGSFIGDAGHATILLLNRASGVAYYFDPNGYCTTPRDIMNDENAYKEYASDAQNVKCLARALITVPVIYDILLGKARMAPEDWTRTRFVNLPGEAGPQAAQRDNNAKLLGDYGGTCSVWSHLFVHLFLLNPQLDPEEVLRRMLLPEQRPFLATIISRYSMFLLSLALKKS
jgi:hypothetical protein